MGQNVTVFAALATIAQAESALDRLTSECCDSSAVSLLMRNSADAVRRAGTLGFLSNFSPLAHLSEGPIAAGPVRRRLELNPTAELTASLTGLGLSLSDAEAIAEAVRAGAVVLAVDFAEASSAECAHQTFVNSAATNIVTTGEISNTSTRPTSARGRGRRREGGQE